VQFVYKEENPESHFRGPKVKQQPKEATQTRVPSAGPGELDSDDEELKAATVEPPQWNGLPETFDAYVKEARLYAAMREAQELKTVSSKETGSKGSSWQMMDTSSKNVHSLKSEPPSAKRSMTPPRR
jgi:hypothetical protein